MKSLCLSIGIMWMSSTALAATTIEARDVGVPAETTAGDVAISWQLRTAIMDRLSGSVAPVFGVKVVHLRFADGSSASFRVDRNDATYVAGHSRTSGDQAIPETAEQAINGTWTDPAPNGRRENLAAFATMLQKIGVAIERDPSGRSSEPEAMRRISCVRRTGGVVCRVHAD